MPSYLERTMSLLKGQDFELLQKVETYNVFAERRQDLYGFLDILGVHPAHGTVGVQVCGQDFAPHVEKMTGPRREALILWLLGDNRCLLIGWRKLKATDWTPRVREFTLADFPEVTPEAQARLRDAVRPDCPPWLRKGAIL